MKRLLTLPFFLLLACIPQVLCAQLVQYEGRPVTDIEIVFKRLSPQMTFDPSAVRARLKTKIGESFSQTDFDEDLKLLATEYDRVEPSLTATEDGLAIRLTLWPQPTIRRIVWTGNEKLSDEQLQKELDIAPGDTFERSAFAAAFKKVRVYYIKKGFFESELTYRVIPDPTTGEVDIEICVREGRTGHIRSVQFRGVSRAEDLELLERVSTRKYSFLLSWATGHGSYQGEAVEQDRFIVLDYLHNKGYADATVEVRVNEVPEVKGIAVEFVAEKGPQYTFGSVTFQGNTLFTVEELLQKLTFKRGDIYSPEKLRASVKEITDLYGSKGYIDTLVNYEQHREVGETIYNIDFEVTEGQQFRVGLVRVFGNMRTQQRVILHESRIRPGEVFDIRRLQQTEELLRNMGYFDTCNVYAVKPRRALAPDETRDGPYYRDVYVEVCEASTGALGLNIGGSTQDGMLTGVELTERNFNICGVPYLFRHGPRVLRGAGEYARLQANIGKKQITLFGAWTKPFVCDTRWIVGLEIERTMNRRQSRDYELDKVRMAANATYPFNCFFRVGYIYRLAYLFTDLRTPPEQLSPTLVQEARNTGTVSAAGVMLTYDSVNFCRTSGFRSILEAEYAGLLGDFDFVKFGYLNTLYFPLRPLGTVKLRCELRLLQPIWDERQSHIPLGERFFLGGESTVRGYVPYSLGPTAPNRDPLGGLTSVLISAELNRRFMRAVDGFIFFDGGYVASHPWQVRKLRTSIGFGVTVRLLAQMPMTFGWGFPLNPQRSDDVEVFYFSVGGHF
jgi:outer membrane protein insertion porin family